MREQDMKVIGHVLIKKENFLSRLLIILQLHCMGRVEEIGQLRWSDFEWFDTNKMKCLRVSLSRFKIMDRNDDLFMFTHRKSYKVALFFFCWYANR